MRKLVNLSIRNMDITKINLRHMDRKEKMKSISNGRDMNRRCDIYRIKRCIRSVNIEKEAHSKYKISLRMFIVSLLFFIYIFYINPISSTYKSKSGE